MGSMETISVSLVLVLFKFKPVPVLSQCDFGLQEELVLGVCHLTSCLKTAGIHYSIQRISIENSPYIKVLLVSFFFMFVPCMNDD